MKYYLIAGEASGDLHASNLIKAIKKIDHKAEFRCFGGDLMRDAGAHVHIHYRDVAMMGLTEVIKKYPIIRKYKKDCRLDILNYHPDVLILIDYSGFNLPMAEFAAKNKIPVIYYISPKLWAWAKWRVKTVKECVKKMFVILPFEVDFYKDHHVEAEYYGNPVLDSVYEFESEYNARVDFIKNNNLDSRPVIALLPGSRKQEIKLLLPEMLDAVADFPDHQFVIAGAPSISPDYYSSFIKGKSVNIVYNQTYTLLKHSVAAIVTSGTATLETALLKVPEIVVYKTQAVTFFIGNFLVKVKFFSLVNLILNKEVVKELLQENLSKDIKSELTSIIRDEKYRNTMLDNYDHLRSIMGSPGVAGRVALRIIQLINS